jgi:hypothetical protein
MDGIDMIGGGEGKHPPIGVLMNLLQTDNVRTEFAQFGCQGCHAKMGIPIEDGKGVKGEKR